MTRLIAALRRLVQPATETNPPAQGSLLLRGEVATVLEDGRLLVSVAGNTQLATPVTDEPLAVGDQVWVSETTDGLIVHGGIR